MAEIGATFVAELKAALASEFPIAAVEFERTIEFPQLLISYAGLNPEAALRGERVPQCQITQRKSPSGCCTPTLSRNDRPPRLCSSVTTHPRAWA